MVGTGLQNNQLFPVLLVVTLGGTLNAVYNIVTAFMNQDANSSGLSVFNVVAIVPLFIALWGASLFKPGNTGAGFASGYTGDSVESN